MEIIIHGTGDTHGVPRIYCECAVCSEARGSKAVNRRFRSAVQLNIEAHPTLWIDCGPDWHLQMEASGQRFITHMLVTHAHFDHIGGLPQWYDQCRYTNKTSYLYAAREVLTEINERYPWLSSKIRMIELDDGLSFGQWNLNVWKVNHGQNGYSYAFRFDHQMEKKSWVYCPDAIFLTKEQQQPLYGLEHLIIGASFFEEHNSDETRSVYDVMEIIELSKQWKPAHITLTHMSHDIDIRDVSMLPDYMQYGYAAQQIKL